MSEEFVDDHRGEFSVESICRVLAQAGYQIAVSSYYARKPRPCSARALADEALDEVLVEIHRENMGVHGVRKMWKATNRALPDQHVARCTIERRMRALGLAGIANRRSARTTIRPSRPTVLPADRLRRDFTTTAPNQQWVADITYVPTWMGMAYAPFVADLFSRRIVDWRVTSALRTDLALDAIEQAIHARQNTGLQGLIHHSDHGVQYCSIAYTDRLH